MSGKKKILALLIGFFVFFYACWAVGMSIYTENMPVVKAKSAVKTALTFEGTIVAHYHRVEKQQEYVSVFDATVEEVLFEDGEDVGMGTPLFSGITVTDRAYLAWDMSANDAIYFERGTPLVGIQLQVRENNRTVPTKMDLSVTSKVYEPKTNRYIYQAQLPESMDYGMVDGAAVAFTAQSQGKHEHGGVIPTSAVTFDETDATFFVLRERERVWGTEYYAEECLAAAEEVAGGQVALTYFPNGGQVIYETSKPLQNGMAVRLEK